MALAAEEMETLISYDRTGKTMHIYSSDPVQIRRFDKTYGKAARTKVHKRDGRTVAVEWNIDKRLLSFRSKLRKLDLSEEQRQELAERARENFALA